MFYGPLKELHEVFNLYGPVLSILSKSESERKKMYVNYQENKNLEALQVKYMMGMKKRPCGF